MVGDHPRVLLDLRARQQVLGQSEEIEVPRGAEPFWSWYAETARFGRPFRLRPVDAPPYPPGDGRVALWFSGGVESTYSLDELRPLNPVLLKIEDYPVFQGEHRRIGQIHFLCAALGSAAGFCRVFLGVERDDMLLSNNPQARRYLERTPVFLDAWSRQHPEHRVDSVCRHLYKEQILLKLRERSLQITGTCDRYRGGRWCGECYKCFEAFYTAKAVGLDLGIRLAGASCARYMEEYRTYVASEFRDNYNNVYQHYARLQIVHGLRFEPERDFTA